MQAHSLVWFRKDLRIYDNKAIDAALKTALPTIFVYIHDQQTHGLRAMGGASKWWLHHSLKSLEESLKAHGHKLVIEKGRALEVLEELIRKNNIKALFWNRLYDAPTIERDSIIKTELKSAGVVVNSSSSYLLFEPHNVINKTGSFFKVFTPFWRHCLENLTAPEPVAVDLTEVKPAEALVDSLSIEELDLLPKNPNWAEGFKEWNPGEEGALKRWEYFSNHGLKDYKVMRDRPDTDFTSKLSPHLHFGEISPAMLFKQTNILNVSAQVDPKNADHFLSEIGWREFSYNLLYNFKDLPTKPFRPEFANFPWEYNDKYLRLWQKGLTGVPIVDAGMRQLWATGWMHNRVRMIVASFLTKNLVLPWQSGEEWFFDTLVDADPASNSASWQWVAGSGADAAPYFRIFNPVLQGLKFDPDGLYVKKWVPELCNVPASQIHEPWNSGMMLNYPRPIVDLGESRKRALEAYDKIKVKLS